MGKPSARGKSTHLTRGSGKPQFLYRQLAGLLRGEIEAGARKPGEMLSSMDDLARDYKLNKATVRQAVAELIAAGLVYSVPAKGTFISDPKEGRHAGFSRALAIGWISSVTDHGRTGRYHTEMMDAVRSAVQVSDGHLLVFCSEGVPPTAFSRTVADARLDGAVLVGPAGEEPFKHLLGSGLPIVLIDDVARRRQADAILVDNEGGGWQAVEHLLSLGHRRIALVTGPAAWRISKDRLKGALAALEDAGIPPSAVPVVESDFSPQGGYVAVTRIMERRPRPTAVFFFNDEMASGALQALHTLYPHIAVPDDLSIVGFDDISWASLTVPPLTSVHIEKALMGQSAVERLKEHIAKRDTHVPTITIVPTRLVVRKSTAPAPSH